MEGEIGKSSGNSSKSNKRRIKMWLFKKMKIKESWRWRWRFMGSAFKWNRQRLQLSFFDDVLFKIVSVLEAICLVGTLCFFFLCCGFRF